MGLFKFNPTTGIVTNESLSIKNSLCIATLEKTKEVKDLFLWNLWLDLSGKSEEFIDTNPEGLDYETIKRRNWNQSFHDLANNYLTPDYHMDKHYLFEKAKVWPRKFTEFHDLCLNRMIQGFYRYGELGNQGTIDRASYLMKKGAYYEKTGNKEALLDCANAAMAVYTEQGFCEKDIWPGSLILGIPLPANNPGAFIKKAAEEYHSEKYPASLITIRNTALTEWIFEKHPKAHFKSLQDADHGERRK